MVKQFTAKVEKQINPIEVGTLHLMQRLIEPVPLEIQRKIIKKSSSDKPYMGFVVEPYSFFIAYKIKDTEFFQSQLPDNFVLEKTKISSNSESDFYFILGSFSARTSGFIGNRVEGYAIARDTTTNLLSWVIVDYVTNTISYDPSNGLTGANVEDGFITTSFDGRIFVNMSNNDYELDVEANLEDSKRVDLDEELWVNGNLSVIYGRKYGAKSEGFGLIFDKREMSIGLTINPKQVEVNANSWFRDYVALDIAEVIYFPYAQHFISESPGVHEQLHNIEQLDQMHDKILEININKYANSNFSKIIEISVLINIVLIFIIILLLII